MCLHGVNIENLVFCCYWYAVYVLTSVFELDTTVIDSELKKTAINSAGTALEIKCKITILK
jgi:hypothetical protein